MGGAKTPESKEKPPLDEQNIPSWLTLFAELSRGIKDSLEKIKSFVHLSREKFGDADYAEYFCKTISGDISKTEAVLNCFTNYLKINSTLPKTNTVHHILEEALKYYENALEDKKIKKQYEENLPETSLRDEQLRFIMTSILQYAIPSIPLQGSIGFLTRSFEAGKVVDGGKSLFQKNEKYIEVLAGFTGYQNGSQQLENILVNPVSPQRENDDFILHLVEKIIKDEPRHDGNQSRWREAHHNDLFDITDGKKKDSALSIDHRLKDKVVKNKAVGSVLTYSPLRSSFFQESRGKDFSFHLLAE
jgi:nitrogen-specific signal transduction histidine kinase